MGFGSDVAASFALVRPFVCLFLLCCAVFCSFFLPLVAFWIDVAAVMLLLACLMTSRPHYSLITGRQFGNYRTAWISGPVALLESLWLNPNPSERPERTKTGSRKLVKRGNRQNDNCQDDDNAWSGIENFEIRNSRQIMVYSCGVGWMQ